LRGILRYSRAAELLYSGLLCDLHPGGEAVHRRLLFFVANLVLRSKGHVQTYQRTIETAVGEGLWEPQGKGSYAITDSGHRLAIEQWGVCIPTYMPSRGGQFEIYLEGMISKIRVTLWSSGERSRAYLDGEESRPMITACEKLERETGVHLSLSSGIFSALYDMAIDHEFEMSFQAR